MVILTLGLWFVLCFMFVGYLGLWFDYVYLFGLHVCYLVCY